MIYLLYANATAETGRELVRVLDTLVPDVVGSDTPPTERVEWLIRWGNSEACRFKPDNVINKRDAVRRATNKLEALVALADAGVAVPMLWRATDRVTEYPVLGRRTNHTQGRDVVLCLQPMDVARAAHEGCSHFTLLVPKLREFRVHCFNNKIIKISEKVLTEPDKYNPVVWNYESGFTFREIRPIAEVFVEKLHYSALTAIQTLGLDFGAVDVIMSNYDSFYCLEVNTGPSLSEASLGIYAQAIQEIVS
jgi:hypothetical protein